MRDNDFKHLHPAFRVHAEDLAAKAAVLQLRAYEGARSPLRQVELYARGRTTGERGKTVTRARAWESLHQYGLAMDFVFYVDGKWSWVEPRKGAWGEFRRLAQGCGLRVLSFEIPHVELPVSLNDLQAGRYPVGGDASWEAWFEAQIELWGPEGRYFGEVMHPAPPPSPSVYERPDEGAIALPPSPFA